MSFFARLRDWLSGLLDPEPPMSSLPDLPLLVDGGQCRGGLPSTIIDVSAAPRLVREGAIPWTRVLEFLSVPGR